MDTDDVVQRFRYERRTLARLDHPNIARIIDGGTTEDGLPYFVMDHVDSVPIDVYCDAARLTVNQRDDGSLHHHANVRDSADRPANAPANCLCASQQAVGLGRYAALAPGTFCFAGRAIGAP